MEKPVNRYISELLQTYHEITQKTLTEMALDFNITLSNLYLYRNENGYLSFVVPSGDNHE